MGTRWGRAGLTPAGCAGRGVSSVGSLEEGSFPAAGFLFPDAPSGTAYPGGEKVGRPGRRDRDAVVTGEARALGAGEVGRGSPAGDSPRMGSIRCPGGLGGPCRMVWIPAVPGVTLVRLCDSAPWPLEGEVTRADSPSLGH